MKLMIKRLYILGCCLTLAACGSVKVEDYAEKKPEMVVQDFFKGELVAHGILKDRGGKVIRHFNATISASWKDGIGILDENFVFDDGEKQQRVWTLAPGNQGEYIGTANDVVGESKLAVSGNSVFLRYTLRIPYDDGTIDVDVDDRMYLVTERVLLNESSMTKWGVEVGQLTLVIMKID